MRIEPVGGGLGAEISGVDLARLEDGSFAQIRRAFTDHLVLFFRDQRIGPEQQVELTRRFGAVLRVPYVAHLEDHPDIIAVLKEADERQISTFGNAWHSDFSFLEKPPAGSLLYALEIPAYGGDTLWSNMYMAYETLSERMRRMLDGLKAIHTGKPYGKEGGVGIKGSRSIQITRGDAGADREMAHPVVRTHAESGRKALFVNAIYTTRFEGMTEAESRPLLDFLFEHAIRPEFTCRFRWSPGALAIWDNRCTLHYAVNDYDGSRRLLHRTTFAGERPV
jgi:taurine dioxygenase